MKKPNALFLSAIVTMAVLTLAMFVSRTSKTSSATTPASQSDVNTVTSHTEATTSGSQSDVNTVTIHTDPINSTSIDNLVSSAQMIVIGSITPSEEIVNMARDPQDHTQQDDGLYGVGQVYQLKVESYLYGTGPEVLNVVQPEGHIDHVNTSEVLPDQAKNAKGNGYPFIPLASGKYLMFLEHLNGFPEAYVTGSGGHPWRFTLIDNIAAPESAEPEYNKQFKPTKKDDLVKLIKDLLKAKGK